MEEKRRHPSPSEISAHVLRRVRELSPAEIDELIDQEGRRLQEAAEQLFAQRRKELAER